MAELVADNELRRQLGALEPLVSRATGIDGGWPALIARLAEPEEPSEDESVSTLRAALQATSRGRELLARLSRDPDQASEQDLAELGPFAAAHPAAAHCIDATRALARACVAWHREACGREYP